MLILSLTYRKRKPASVVEVVFNDGQVLDLDPELAVKFQLAAGEDISQQAMDELRNAQESLTARRRLVRYMSLRRKSGREASDYLLRAGFSPDAVESAMAGARELGLIDDARFAAAYTRTQQRATHKGPRAIRHELMMRGVNPGIAAQTVAPSATPETQKEHARAAAVKKAASLQKEPPNKARAKLYAHLLRKGYDPDVASQVTHELFNEKE
ncbi:MAG: RecX family transcriptional regulator [bacterium]|nr:RecX family transcriptional regulator [Candidatus Sumerlaeota bacterium]